MLIIIHSHLLGCCIAICFWLRQLRAAHLPALGGWSSISGGFAVDLLPSHFHHLFVFQDLGGQVEKVVFNKLLLQFVWGNLIENPRHQTASGADHRGRDKPHWCFISKGDESKASRHPCGNVHFQLYLAQKFSQLRHETNGHKAFEKGHEKTLQKSRNRACQKHVLSKIMQNLLFPVQFSTIPRHQSYCAKIAEELFDLGESIDRHPPFEISIYGPNMNLLNLLKPWHPGIIFSHGLFQISHINFVGFKGAHTWQQLERLMAKQLGRGWQTHLGGRPAPSSQWIPASMLRHAAQGQSWYCLETKKRLFENIHEFEAIGATKGEWVILIFDLDLPHTHGVTLWGRAMRTAVVIPPEYGIQSGSTGQKEKKNDIQTNHFELPT